MYINEKESKDMLKEELIQQDAKQLQEQLVSWRRALHQIPERGIELPQTTKFICERLDEMNVSYELYEDISCIVATIGSGGKCFMLRSDIDALPIEEETDLDFKSTNGRMHACGHDLHGTILLGAAHLLKKYENELKGTVKLLFQSGEETLQGATAMIERGFLENPKIDAGLAFHVNNLPLGVASTGKEAMSSVHGFYITLHGKGGHGSMPEACIDPINAAVQIYLAFQSLIAREVGGPEEAVLTVGQMCAGDSYNIIPVEAMMQGTLRTFRAEVKERLVKRMKEVVQGVAMTYRCVVEYKTLFECSSLITDESVTKIVENSMLKVVPELEVRHDGHWMGSEDFAEFSQRFPCAHFMIGAAPEDETKRFGLHDPRILFNEEVLWMAAGSYAQAAIDWLATNQ